MAFTKILAAASLLVLALAAAPGANAQNDGNGVTVSAPHKVVDPARQAARQAKRQHRREMRRQARLRQQGIGPTGAAAPGPN